MKTKKTIKTFSLALLLSLCTGIIQLHAAAAEQGTKRKTPELTSISIEKKERKEKTLESTIAFLAASSIQDCLQPHSKLLKYLNSPNRNGDILLHNASRDGRKKEVRALLSANADVNSKDDAQWTALHFASDNGESRIASYLLAAQADVNAQNWSGLTPLHLALQNGDSEIIDKLLDPDADMNIQDNNGWAAAHYALDNRDREWEDNQLVHIILENTTDINIKGGDGNTPLHVVALGGDSSFIAELIELKADVNAQNLLGLTPLHIACQERRSDIVAELLKAGPNIDLLSETAKNALSLALQGPEIDRKSASMLIKHKKQDQAIKPNKSAQQADYFRTCISLDQTKRYKANFNYQNVTRSKMVKKELPPVHN